MPPSAITAWKASSSERISLRIIGILFLALAAYVAADATQSLITRQAPDPSLVGLVLAAASQSSCPSSPVRREELLSRWALAMVPIIVREGIEAVRGRAACADVAPDQCIPFIICSCALISRCTRSACARILVESAWPLRLGNSARSCLTESVSALHSRGSDIFICRISPPI
jgi:hypothetical protein